MRPQLEPNAAALVRWSGCFDSLIGDQRRRLLRQRFRSHRSCAVVEQALVAGDDRDAAPERVRVDVSSSELLEP